MRGRSAAIAVAALVLAMPAGATQLIANGDFETGDFSGWTRFGALGFTSVNVASAHDGEFGASFSPNQSGGLSQTFATLPGYSYTISLWLAHTTAAATPINSIFVDFGGVNIAGFSGYGALPYTRLSFTRVATASSTTLMLSFRDARPTVFRLDDVSVTGTVPEPETWALMIGGFGIAGAALRRRRLAA